MQAFSTGIMARVVQAYRRPYPDPIKVRAGERVIPDPTKVSDWPGWLWCSADSGKQGWTPQAWLTYDGAEWRITRDFDALELTVDVGDLVAVFYSESGFVWSRTADGREGWLPASHLEVLDK